MDKRIFRFDCKCKNCGSKFNIISYNHFYIGERINHDLKFLHKGTKIAINSNKNNHYCKDKNETGGIIYELLGYELIEDENKLEKYREKLKSQEEIFEYY